MKKETIGSLAAAAIAGILASAPLYANPPVSTDGHYCQNNSCKGKSMCKGMGNNSCKGHNDCSGHGWLDAADQAACEKAGGQWAMAPKDTGAKKQAKKTAKKAGKTEKKK